MIEEKGHGIGRPMPCLACLREGAGAARRPRSFGVRWRVEPWTAGGRLVTCGGPRSSTAGAGASKLSEVSVALRDLVSSPVPL